MKKIAIVGTVGLPACYGGWETLVDNIVKNDKENEYTVFCSSKAYAKKTSDYNGAKLIYLPFSANGMSSIIYDITSLIMCIYKKYDAVLILGVSGCVFLPIFKAISNKKVITNIDGIEWKRDKWSSFASWFLKFSEKVAIKFSDLIVTDNQGIYEYVKSEYNVHSEVIAYGGEHALSDQNYDDAESETFGDYFLSVCRIEPENNVHMVLDAFSKSSENIKFIGNWNSSSYGIELKSKYSKFGNIEIIDPIYDLNILYKYRLGCKGYIHGHSVGGTNPSLVEIMHFGKQVYAFDCVFNKYTTAHKALYFCSANELCELLNEHHSANNKEMLEVARTKYTWEVITQKYVNLY